MESNAERKQAKFLLEFNLDLLKVINFKHETRKGGLGCGFDRRSSIDKMLFYKGIRDYNKFRCYELEGGNLEVFKKKLKGMMRACHRKNWASGRLVLEDGRDFGI